MSIRMLRYICEFYEFIIKTDRPKMLPAVFPLMVYNGSRKWTAPVNSDKLIHKSINGRFIPSFEYYKIDESEFQKEFLADIKNTVSAIFYMEQSTLEDIINEIDKIREMIKSERPEEFKEFINWVKYIFLDKKDDHEMFNRLIQNMGQTMSGLSESIKKRNKELKELKELKKESIQIGFQKGIEKGIQQGALQKATVSAKILLKKKMPEGEIAEITGLSMEYIKRLAKDLNK